MHDDTHTSGCDSKANSVAWSSETVTQATGAPGSAMHKNPFDEAEVISAHTRAQALEDGVLHDVSAIAGKLGWTCPVAFTASVKAFFEAIGDAHGQPQFRDEVVALLVTASFAVEQALLKGEDGYITPIKLKFPSPHHDVRKRVDEREIWVSVTGEGEGGSPVATIMFPSDY